MIDGLLRIYSIFMLIVIRAVIHPWSYFLDFDGLSSMILWAYGVRRINVYGRVDGTKQWMPSDTYNWMFPYLRSVVRSYHTKFVANEKVKGKATMKFEDTGNDEVRRYRQRVVRPVLWEA
jgi:hypothetical protein